MSPSFLLTFLLISHFAIPICAAMPPESQLDPTIHNDRYPDLANDFSCAKRNDQAQREFAPDWSYKRHSPNNSPQPFQLAWEPILEAVPDCNGLGPNFEKKFSFMIVLDASWVRYFNDHKAHFTKHGYPTLQRSPYLMMDRVQYLFRKQFGVDVSTSRVIELPNLMEACDTNGKIVDDGSFETSTKLQLEKADIVPAASEAGIMRLGVGSRSGTYCHSYAGLGSLCKMRGVATTQRRPFLHDGSGRLDYTAFKTLAHEFGHVFGICRGGLDKHCLNSHTQNELPDIMVYDGRPAKNARSEGMFFKFFTACTPLYEDILCLRVKTATCGVSVRVVPESPSPSPSTSPLQSPRPSPSQSPMQEPSSTPSVSPESSPRGTPEPRRKYRGPSIKGEFVYPRYGAKANNWHFVKVTHLRRNIDFQWKNRAGVWWNLYRDANDDTLFHVDEICPYYASGYRNFTVQMKKNKKGRNVVTALRGPERGLYMKKRELSPWDPVFCTAGDDDSTCWAETAYEKCAFGRQAAKAAVLAKKSKGVKVMYKQFKKLVKKKVGCTKL